MIAFKCSLESWKIDIELTIQWGWGFPINQDHEIVDIFMNGSSVIHEKYDK